MKRILEDHCHQKVNIRQLALERGRGSAPGTPPPPRPPAEATLLLLRPPPLPGAPPSKLHVAALPGPALGSRWPQTPGLQPHRRRRRREEPTHFGALSSPLSTSISPAAAAGSQAPLPSHFLLPSGHTCPRPPSSAPARRNWQIRQENQLSGSQPPRAREDTGAGRTERCTALGNLPGSRRNPREQHAATCLIGCCVWQRPGEQQSRRPAVSISVIFRASSSGSLCKGFVLNQLLLVL